MADNSIVSAASIPLPLVPVMPLPPIAQQPTSRRGMARDVYLAAEKGDVTGLRWLNDWKLQKTAMGSNVLHIHVGMPLDMLKLKVRISFIQYVLGETAVNPLLFESNDKGDTPLHIAARFGHTYAVEQFLKQPEETNAHVGIVELLNKANNNNDTALHDAVRGGYDDIVKLLVEAGGENAALHHIHMPNNLGETPLFLAAEGGLTESFSAIVEHTSGLNALHHRGPYGNTPLHVAVLCGSKDIVKHILRIETSASLIKIQNERGETALHCCAAHDARKQRHILKSFLDHDEEHNSAAYIQDNEGRTALHIAALHKNFTGAKMLINTYPDCTEMVDHKGRNALHVATNTGSISGLVFFLSVPRCKRLLNEKDNEGNTPLHLLIATTPTGIINNWLFQLPIILNRHNELDVTAVNNKGLTAGDIIASNKKIFPPVNYRTLSKKLPRGRRINTIDDDDDDDIVHGDEGEETIEIIKRTTETKLVVAALIVTVSFTAGFTLPGGFDQTSGKTVGLALLRKKPAFAVFLLADSFAFAFSSMAILFYFAMASRNDLIAVKLITRMADYITLISLGSLTIAFVSGVFAVVSHSLGMAVIYISLSFFLFYLTVTLGSLRVMWDSYYDTLRTKFIG